MKPRIRQRPPELRDLSDSAAVNKFAKECEPALDTLYDGYMDIIRQGDANSLSGGDALKMLQQTEEYLCELANKCTSFCPHISEIPYSKVHFWVPAFKAVICHVCVPEWNLSHQVDDYCDLCESPQTEFMETNIQMGAGVMVFHLGECCIDKFK